MLTKRIKRDTTIRLHKVLVKYTTMAGYYWDPNLGKFVSLETYQNWTWLASYYVGQILQIFLAVYLYLFSEFNSEISDDAKITSIEKENTKRTVILLTGVILWMVITQLLSLGSIAVQYRSEMIEGMNQIWALDNKLKQSFPNIRPDNIKTTEKCIIIICWVTLLFPILFLPALFHPGNPINGLVTTFIEIPITVYSLFGWVFGILQTYTVYLFTGPIVCLLILGVLTMHQCQWWLEAATPVDHVEWVNGQLFIKTRNLGLVSENTLVWLYRSIQLLIGLTNLVYEKRRLSYHGFVTVVIFVLSTFLLMRYHEFILGDGSLSGYSILALLMLSVSLLVLIIGAECYLLDGLENACADFKFNLFEVTKGNRRVRRESMSFAQIALKSSYPFCAVSRSTFLEWCDVCVNNLVNLLVM